jgi:hypothetical protein
MRKIFSALVLILGLTVVPAAHASSITYNLTLTSFGGGIGGNVAGGTGSITVDNTPGSGVDFFSQPGFSGHRITDLSFNIGGDVFTLADAVSLTTATFFNGFLTGVHYDGVLSSGKVNINFDSISLLYAFSDDLSNKNSFGTISGNVATAPEPSALLLLGSGALGLVGFARRKFAA